MHRIYRINRPTESASFASHVSNKRLLFHSSRPDSYLGILSRGLLLPGVVTAKLGVNRTDVGNLGAGIYFASAASASAKFSALCSYGGSRLMLVHQVALGTVKEYTKTDSTLTKPPEAYQSCCGVGPEKAEHSEFEVKRKNFTMFQRSIMSRPKRKGKTCNTRTFYIELVVILFKTDDFLVSLCQKHDFGEAYLIIAIRNI